VTTPETPSANETAVQKPVAPEKITLFAALRAAVNKWWGGVATPIAGKSSNELAEIRTDLAVSRNLMAADRTLMAWIRTALSMNSFGFTIYKLLATYQQSGAELPKEESPRDIGLFLTGLGTLAMVMGVIEYWQTLKELHGMKEFRILRPTFVMGIVMAGMGLFLFFAIITKLF
jgi:putative membrane protein